jgi:WD40 repeat protein
MPGEHEGTTLPQKDQQSGLRDLVVSSSGEWLTFLTKEGRIQSWQRGEDEVFTLLWKRDDSSQGKALAVTPDQSLVACLMGEGSIQIYDGESGQKLHTLKAQGSPWTCMAFVPQSDSLVIGSRDGTICYFDTQSWQKQGCLRLASSAVTSFAVSPKCRLIGVRLANGQASLAPLSVQASTAQLPTYSSVEVGNLFPAWFQPVAERINR